MYPAAHVCVYTHTCIHSNTTQNCLWFKNQKCISHKSGMLELQDQKMRSIYHSIVPFLCASWWHGILDIENEKQVLNMPFQKCAGPILKTILHAYI